MENGKLHLFEYNDTQTRMKNLIILDLNSGEINMKPLPSWWSFDYKCSCDSILGNFFVAIKEGNSSVILVKYFEEKSGDWITVAQVPNNDEWPNEFTWKIKVKAIENRLHIMHEIVFRDDRRSWFLHILRVSIEKGEVICDWDLLFSKVRDPKGKFNPNLYIEQVQVVEL